MKKLIALLMAIVLCLSFAACGEKEPNKPEEPPYDAELHMQKLTELLCENDGIWFGKRHGKGTEYEFEFFEDGTFKFDGNTYSWANGRFYTPEDAEREMGAFIFQTSPDFDYSKGLYSGEDVYIGYNTDGEVVIYQHSDYLCYQESRPSGAQYSDFKDHAYLNDIFGTWEFKKNHSENEYKLYKSLTINQNGTCIIDGEKAGWRIEDDDSDIDVLYIGIYDKTSLEYGACFEMRNDDVLGRALFLFPAQRPDGVMAQPNYSVRFEKVDESLKEE